MPPRKPYSEMTPDELEATREYMRKKKMEQRAHNRSTGIAEQDNRGYRDRASYQRERRKRLKSEKDTPEISD